MSDEPQPAGTPENTEAAPDAVPGAPGPALPVSPQQPAWAKPATQLVWQETPPLGYHQLLRGVAKYSWWRPLLALLLGTTYYLVLSVIYMVIVLVPYVLLSGQEFSEDLVFAVSVPDTREPISLLLTLGSVALMLPAVWLAMLSTGLRPTGRVWSAALKMRWGWLGRTILPALGAMAVLSIAAVVISVAVELFYPTADLAVDADGTLAAVNFDPTIMLWSSLFILLLVPVQATAEEVVFRGAFMQGIGAWFYNRGASRFARFVRGPVLPIVLPSVLFGFAHIYDIWGWLAVVSMALVFGWLTWRTGGLEAAISLHVMNNLVAFGFMVAAVDGETKQTSDGGDWVSLLSLWCGLAFYVWIIERGSAKHGILRSRIDFVPQEVAVPAAPTTPSHAQPNGATS